VPELPSPRILHANIVGIAPFAMHNLAAFQACARLATAAPLVVVGRLAREIHDLSEERIIAKIRLVIRRFQRLLDKRVFRLVPVARSLRHCSIPFQHQHDVMR
jgi:hypothetical protein